MFLDSITTFSWSIIFLCYPSRLAVNNMQYLNNLGIKDPIHRQKITLKAMDVVLFGPPKGKVSISALIFLLNYLLIIIRWSVSLERSYFDFFAYCRQHRSLVCRTTKQKIQKPPKQNE